MINYGILEKRKGSLIEVKCIKKGQSEHYTKKEILSENKLHEVAGVVKYTVILY